MHRTPSSRQLSRWDADESTLETDAQDEWPSFVPRTRFAVDSDSFRLHRYASVCGKGIFAEARYLDEHQLISSLKQSSLSVPWRVKDRMKTVAVALVACLNLGVDPPDVQRIPPHARLQCWIDPTEHTPAKALENIGRNLQAQYEVWQAKARFKQCLDPTAEDVKKLCISIRKSAKDERVLFHYNGHGVPRPTSNGEIWVFNKQYTQYIPLSLYELQAWMTNPAMYVFDCSAAGLIIKAYLHFADQRERENERKLSSGSSFTTASEPPINAHDCIILGACEATESIPMNPDMPADLFTSCLTTPIQVAIRWFALRSPLLKISVELAEKLPGRMIDRRTPLGELNWIFTAITDTIAWNSLPAELFQKLFRQDTLVASLMRNFFLAERVMRSYNCTPVSFPKLPSTHTNYLWESWDMAVESYISQMGAYAKDANYEFKMSTFFTDQLSAFEMWLELGSESIGKPQQLPIVLQVLLSQSHRLRALSLLARFLDLGPWAVNMALSVGIFPYVLKLLQSPSAELRETLVFIWTKILAVDQSCQVELIKDGCHIYFMNILTSQSIPVQQRIAATYIVSLIVHKFPTGQNMCLSEGMLDICIVQLVDPNEKIRLWTCLCLANLWNEYDEAKVAAIKQNVPDKLLQLLSDTCPEVRAAAVYALGRFVGRVNPNHEHRENVEHSIGIALLFAASDMSSLVRRELVVALSRLVDSYLPSFCDCAFVSLVADIRKKAQDQDEPIELTAEIIAADEELGKQQGSTFGVVWEVICSLAHDPVLPVSLFAETVIFQLVSMFKTKLPLERSSLPSTLMQQRPRPQILCSSLKLQPSATTNPASSNPPMKKSSSFVYSAPDQQDTRSFRSYSDDSMGFEKIQLTNTPDSFVEDDSMFRQETFFEWNCKKYNTPKHLLEQDVFSASFIEKKWKQHRNDLAREEMVSLRSKTVSSKFDKQIAILDNSSELIYAMAFHPFESHLVVADEKSRISVWDIESGTKLNTFHNRCPPKTRVNSFKVYADPCATLLAVSSDDAVIRLWKGVESYGEQILVSAWKAFPALSCKQNASGLVMDWAMDADFIAASGDVRSIKLWSAQKETNICEIPTNTEASVTCIASKDNIISTGFSDGSVRLYDIRVPQNCSLVHSYAEHKAWVVDTFIQKATHPEIVSGSINGDIRFWDIRAPTSVKSIVAHSSSMVCFTAHENVPLMASASNNQQIKIYNTKAETLNILQYHSSFLGQRLDVVSRLSFHP
eukprot:TRINITY_DN7103_c0_g1_i3.p1 TRINITY_DN7103_c0_g1~~TRINITY_DN7103_c0_g1_i3.p1  ORF type:complete len:1237 (-),score=213.22 TRINITY_DN7103_c0_g1_i3:198-3908(-)